MARRRIRKEPSGKVLKALWLVVVNDYSQRRAGKEVGLSHTTVGRWLKKYNLHRGVGKQYPQILRFYDGIEDKVVQSF